MRLKMFTKKDLFWLVKEHLYHLSTPLTAHLVSSRVTFDDLWLRIFESSEKFRAKSSSIYLPWKATKSKSFLVFKLKGIKITLVFAFRFASMHKNAKTSVILIPFNLNTRNDFDFVAVTSHQKWLETRRGEPSKV